MAIAMVSTTSRPPTVVIDSFKRLKIFRGKPGGEGGLIAPDEDTGLCEDGTSDGVHEPGWNERTDCIRKHKDHCDRVSQFSIWMKNPYDEVKNISITFTKWAIYDHSVPKGGGESAWFTDLLCRITCDYGSSLADLL